jgi:hypothetical protein
MRRSGSSRKQKEHRPSLHKHDALCHLILKLEILPSVKFANAVSGDSKTIFMADVELK